MHLRCPDTDPIALQDVADANRVHYSTVTRWRSRGIAGHKLNSFRIGGRWFVRREDLEAFDRGAVNQQPRPNVDAARDGTDAELDRLNI